MYSNPRSEIETLTGSAGVGRTGSYIVVDSVLEGLRREHSLHARVIRGSGSSVSRHRHTLSEVKSEGKLSPDPSIDTASPVSGGKSIHGKSKLEVVSRAPLSSSPGPMDVDMTKKVSDTTPEQSDRRRWVSLFAFPVAVFIIVAHWFGIDYVFTQFRRIWRSSFPYS